MRIASLHTYPVKGCHRLDHDAAQVQPWGLAGDRRWMVVDPDGVGVTQRTAPTLTGLRAAVVPGGLVLSATGRADLPVPEPHDGPPVTVRVFTSQPPVPARVAVDAGGWLGALLDRPVRLVWLADPTVRLVPPPAVDTDRVSFADAFPLLLANAASLDAVNDWLYDSGDDPVPVTRFRPNLVVADAPPWAEDEWAGRRLQIGTTVLRAARGCARCVVTTVDQETGEKGRQPLHALGVHRRFPDGLLFGLNLVPDTTGVVRVGDAVTVVP